MNSFVSEQHYITGCIIAFVNTNWNVNKTTWYCINVYSGLLIVEYHSHQVNHYLCLQQSPALCENLRALTAWLYISKSKDFDSISQVIDSFTLMGGNVMLFSLSQINTHTPKFRFNYDEVLIFVCVFTVKWCTVASLPFILSLWSNYTNAFHPVD